MGEDLRTLVQSAAAGDAGAFGELVRRHRNQMLGTAYAVLSNADDARDACQEALVRAWNRLSELRDAALFGSWLTAMARNAAIDLRRRRPLPAPADVDGCARSAGLDGLEEVVRTERDQRIEAALDSLDVLSREIVTLRYFAGLGAPEIAVQIGLSEAAVNQRLSRARRSLAALLQPLQVEAEHGS